MIVLDASAALDLLLGTLAGARIARRIGATGETLHAPHLIDVEVAHVLRRYDASGVLSSTRAAEAFADFGDLGLVRHPHDVLLPRIWELRRNVTAYDAAYIALAEALGAPLLTSDGRLMRTAGPRARIELA